MPKHEIKSCPLCGTSFECKPGNIGQCQCYGVVLDKESIRYVRENFESCLCRSCLQKIAKEKGIES
ncbi:cysteine-rich CWC family protein [Porifericola rhodea]|uniref:cysteine-rich CWC family protein n=1 Tax=Porifericola rhodea TaxID=930972 RepID=UPI00345CAF04